MSLPSEPSFLNPRFKSLWYGGDYNPEQWPAHIWDEDVSLMQACDFHVATMLMFAWARLEPRDGEYDFEWLDQVIEKLTAGDRWFILGTPSAAPPAWLSKKYPETIRTGPDRVLRGHGNRVNFNLGSEIYREKTRAIAEALAKRYGNHPRLLAWHMSNEYSGADYSPQSIAQFRQWLKNKFDNDLGALNHAYWSAFWGHTFTDWEEIDAPGDPYHETAMQGLTVDWMRFVTDQTIDFMENEAEPLRRISPHVPITTNMMGTYPGLDYRKMAKFIDFVSWDSYPASVERLDNPETWFHVGFKHDLMRSLKPEKPWLLMEYTPSSANWYNIMQLKRPGVHRFESMHALAHGADGLQYFQWRQSRGGQEQYHGAVVGHTGTDNTRVFSEVKEVGHRLTTLGDLVGSLIPSKIALVYDWENRWALDAACGPTRLDKKYEKTCVEHYRALRLAGHSVDIVGMDDDLSPYKLVVAPMAFSLRPIFAQRVKDYVAGGGALVTGYLAGWVDENSLVYEDGILSPWQEMLGVRSEEIDVLFEDQRNQVVVHAPSDWCPPGAYECRDFCELIHAEGAQVLATYGENFYADRPALTVNSFGHGTAIYVASRNSADFLSALLPAVAKKVGLAPILSDPLPDGVTAQLRKKGNEEFVLILNANAETIELKTDEWGEVTLPARDMVVLTRNAGETKQSPFAGVAP